MLPLNFYFVTNVKYDFFHFFGFLETRVGRAKKLNQSKNQVFFYKNTFDDCLPDITSLDLNLQEMDTRRFSFMYKEAYQITPQGRL